MSIRDHEAFLRQRAVAYDPNIDVSPGSPFDTQVIQPLLRRLGTDPFTQDLSTFIHVRMAQAFPDISNQEEDAVTDLLNKPATLLFDPLVREVNRVKQNLSFSDPTRMTADEAEALGANFFSPRKRGGIAKGVGRILFSSPQNVSVTPANFFTSRNQLNFFPTEQQSIRSQEMILNITPDGLYYFDVNVVAEAAGTAYNIGPNELIQVANMPAATRVTNTRKFRAGADEESTQGFISRVQQELSERSMVTIRGAAAKLVSGFPEINRLNVVGFSDPEMQRDILRGGGLGAVVAGGNSGVVVADGEGKNRQRRFLSTEADFVALTGASGAVSGYVLTVFDAFGGTVVVQDLTVTHVAGPNEVIVQEQVLVLGASNLRWTLRKTELTLSSIPGGILFPNTPYGELVIKNDEVHVGGMTDTYIRGADFDEETFTIANVTDDDPLLSGLTATVADSTNSPGTNVFVLNSLVEGTDFVDEESDPVVQALDAAVRFGYTLQVQDAPEAGTYRVLSAYAVAGGPLEVTVTPTPSAITSLNMRWRLFDELNVDLLGPKETRIKGTDLSTLQNSDVVKVAAGTDFNALGVSQGDTLEIYAGASVGQYVITAPPLTPESLQIDTVLKDTAGSLSYAVYRANAGALRPPFIRIKSVELLDSSGQPLGTTVPYARPVDIQTRAFQNPARGIKWDLVDAYLGLISAPAPFNVSLTDLQVFVLGASSPQTRTLTLTTTGIVPLATIIAELNAQFLAQFGIPEAVVAVGTDRFGIRPVGLNGVVAVTGGGAQSALFGNAELRTTGDVRSSTIAAAGGWDSLEPAVDFVTGLDVLQVLDGPDVGFYPAPFTTQLTQPALGPTSALLVGALSSSSPLADIEKTFAPVKQRQVQVGSRSLGSARVYFLEPTSFEVDADTRFYLDMGASGTIKFLPDPTLEYQKLPALPSNAPIQDGESAAGGNVLSSASQDFTLSGVRAGDSLVIETHPIEGTLVLADPVVGLAGKTLVFSLDGQVDRTAIFIRDDAALAVGEVSRDGVIEQINLAAGDDIVELTGDNRLRFNTHKSLVVRGTGQSTSHSYITGNVADTGGTLTFDGPDDVGNRSPHAGRYDVLAVSQQQLTLDISGGFPAATPFTYATVPEQSFKVYRSGVQRISTTDMSANVAEAGLYYFDVELISEGSGDLYNIDAQEQLTATGYRADGYYLTTDDPNLTFSALERPRLVLSRTILEEGVDDDPSNATQLTGENLDITYERSQLVSDVQNFVSSETERVVCSNPLSRHLIPYFVRFDALYVGGAREDVVLTELNKYVEDLAPVATLDASDVQKIITDQGASYVKNPLSLVAVVHQLDRGIWVERSQDKLATNDRLSAFISDRISVTRQVT